MHLNLHPARNNNFSFSPIFYTFFFAFLPLNGDESEAPRAKCKIHIRHTSPHGRVRSFNIKCAFQFRSSAQIYWMCVCVLVNRCRHKCQFMFKMEANGRMNGCLVDDDDDGDGVGSKIQYPITSLNNHTYECMHARRQAPLSMTSRSDLYVRRKYIFAAFIFAALIDKRT